MSSLVRKSLSSIRIGVPREQAARRGSSKNLLWRRCRKRPSQQSLRSRASRRQEATRSPPKPSSSSKSRAYKWTQPARCLREFLFACRPRRLEIVQTRNPTEHRVQRCCIGARETERALACLRVLAPRNDEHVDDDVPNRCRKRRVTSFAPPAKLGKHVPPVNGRKKHCVTFWPRKKHDRACEI